MADAGPLLISGGGAVGVETDAMSAAAVQLTSLRDALAELRHRAAHAPSLAAASARAADPVAALFADTAGSSDAATAELAAALRLAHSRVEELSGALRSAATGYAETEATAEEWMRTVSGAGAWTLGAVAPTALVGMAIAAWAAWKLTPGDSGDKQKALGAWMTAHPDLITNPGFVAVVRAIAGSTDDFVWGLGHVPTPAAKNGGSGVEFGGDAVLSLGALVGLFRESSVQVGRVGSGTTTPPTGIADRFSRIPGAETDAAKRPPGGAQVRIERYAAPGERPHWIVYVDPTETFTPSTTEEPWDLTSNIDGVAGHTAGSFRATEAAMAKAGIDADDPVAFVGFSQGGLVAGMLAGSGDWNAQGLESFGGPIGNIPLPGDLAGMTVRHSDDFVPALAGPDLPSDRLLVEQRAFPDGAPTDLPAPAHQGRSYRATAQQIDAASSPEIRGQLATLYDFAAGPLEQPGATATYTEYRADRTGDWTPAVLTPQAPRAY